MDYGIKMSEEGVGVASSEPTQLNYSSQWSNFKIKEILTFTITLTGSQTFKEATYTTSLNYSPVYFPFVNSSTIPNKWKPAMMGGSITMPDDTDWGGALISYRPANNLFYINVGHIGSGTRVFTFKVVIFIDSFLNEDVDFPPTGNFGMKISQSDNVKNISDTKLSMTSKFKNLTIFSADTATITDTGNITHDLGYVPIYIAFYNPTGDGTAGDRYYCMPISGSWNGGSRHIEVWADSSKLYFSTNDAVNATKFKYIIFNERLI